MASKKISIPYGFLIDLYEKYSSDDSILIDEVKRNYPSLYIGRNDRFIKTIQRIVLPTVPSILGGKVSISGDSLRNYRQKIWTPRARNLSKMN